MNNDDDKRKMLTSSSQLVSQSAKQGNRRVEFVL